MNNYDVQTILSKDDISKLLTCYSLCDAVFAHQDYNLFDIEKRVAPSNNEQLNKLNDYANAKKHGHHYFLKYTKDSFTRMHTDDSNVVGKTIVTLVESRGLVGGETLIMDRYKSKPRPAYKYAKRVGDTPSYGKNIIPRIVDMEDGQSVIYNHNTQHGVCQVKEGYRIVLVSWYSK